jgi:hypothetical protein
MGRGGIHRRLDTKFGMDGSVKGVHAFPLREYASIGRKFLELVFGIFDAYSPEASQRPTRSLAMSPPMTLKLVSVGVQ